MSPRNLFSIRWTESAWKDLDDISDYLLGEGMPFDAAAEYVKRIFKAPEHLAAFPYEGKPGRMSKTREWLVKGTPYALIYVVRDEKVFVLRVMHGSRQFPEQ